MLKNKSVQSLFIFLKIYASDYIAFKGGEVYRLEIHSPSLSRKSRNNKIGGKKMRKLVGLLFVFMLVFGVLAACGGGSDDTSSSTDNSGGNDSANNEAAEENVAAENDGSEEGEEASGEFESVTIAIGHATADNETSHYHQGILKFEELITEATDGQVTIEIHPNGVLGGEREMIEAVQLGTLDMVLTSSGPLGNFADKSYAFDFPFLFRDRDHAYKVLDGEIGQEVNDQIAETGMINLVWMENGFRHLTNNVRPVMKPEDLDGIKLRTMENDVHLSAFREYGADPTPMAFTELFTALQQGVVDGQENPLAVIVPNKLHEVQDYLTLSNHIYSPAPFLINKDLFDGFSPQLQEAIIEAAEGARDYERQFIQDMDQEFLETIKEQGTEITEEYDYDAFFEATQPVYDEYEAEYGDILDRILATE